MAELTDNLVYKLKCVALRVWGTALVAVNVTCLDRQHPDEIGRECKWGQGGEVKGMLGGNAGRCFDRKWERLGALVGFSGGGVLKVPVLLVVTILT